MLSGVGSAACKALSTEQETKLSAALSFLHREYEPRYFWWEILEVVKKLVLVGFAAILMPGSVMQLVIAMMVSLLLLLLNAVAAPYRSDVHDFIALGSSFCLCGVFFWSLGRRRPTARGRHPRTQATSSSRRPRPRLGAPAPPSARRRCASAAARRGLSRVASEE